MRHKTTILFVNHTAKLGGAEHSLRELIGHLDQAAFETITALPPLGPLKVKGRLVRVPALRRLRRPRHPGQILWTFSLLRRGARHVKRIIRDENVDLVHANSTTAALYALPAARGMRRPAIWHCRDTVALGRVAPWLAARSDAIVAVSNTVYAALRPQIGGSRPVHTIMNGIDTAAFRPTGEADIVRPEWKIPPDAVAVGMIGQLVPWKRHDVFMDMAERVAAEREDIRFVIVGSDMFGDHCSYVEQIARRAQAGKLRGKVVFAGYRADIPRVLDAMDIVVHPAAREPFGRAVCEAMAMEKPVVGVTEGGISEIVRNQRDGILVPPEDIGEMAGAVLTLAADPALRRKMGKTAREGIIARFDIARTAESVMSLYRKLLCA